MTGNIETAWSEEGDMHIHSFFFLPSKRDIHPLLFKGSVKGQIRSLHLSFIILYRSIKFVSLQKPIFGF